MSDIKVDLDKSVNPHIVVVDDKGGIKINKNPKPQTISWKLEGNLKNGQFEPITNDPDSGFRWLDPKPAAGVFDIPVLKDASTKLELVDNHLNDDSNGEWRYCLRVKDKDGAIYKTELSIGTPAVPKSPIIINQ